MVKEFHKNETKPLAGFKPSIFSILPLSIPDYGKKGFTKKKEYIHYQSFSLLAY
jgi:hypothetical protein